MVGISVGIPTPTYFVLGKFCIVHVLQATVSSAFAPQGRATWESGDGQAGIPFTLYQCFFTLPSVRDGKD